MFATIAMWVRVLIFSFLPSVSFTLTLCPCEWKKLPFAHIKFLYVKCRCHLKERKTRDPFNQFEFCSSYELFFSSLFLSGPLSKIRTFPQSLQRVFNLFNNSCTFLNNFLFFPSENSYIWGGDWGTFFSFKTNLSSDRRNPIISS